MHALVEAWRRLDVGQPPYVMPEDLPSIPHDMMVQYPTFSAFAASADFGSQDTRLHVGLLPMPYMGDLENAAIFLLMLNPGLEYGDYAAELDVPGTRERLLQNLRQELGQADCPFTLLDPAMVLHPGFRYWERKFRAIAGELSCQCGVSYREALSRLAKRVAGLELVPYHSPRFGLRPKEVNALRSAQLARDYFHRVLVPRAERNQAMVIVLKAAGSWDPPPHENVVVLRGGQALGAFITPKTKAGQAIMRRLRLKVA